MSQIIRRKAVIAALKKLVADNETYFDKTLRDMSINPDICGCMKDIEVDGIRITISLDREDEE